MEKFIAMLVIAAASVNSLYENDFAADTVKSFVALQLDFGDGKVQNCGGVLGVPEDRILTSASCIYE